MARFFSEDGSPIKSGVHGAKDLRNLKLMEKLGLNIRGKQN